MCVVLSEAPFVVAAAAARIYSRCVVLSEAPLISLEAKETGVGCWGGRFQVFECPDERSPSFRGALRQSRSERDGHWVLGRTRVCRLLITMAMVMNH